MLKAIKKGLLYAHRIDGKKERNTFMNGFLPVCKQDLIDRGIEQLDFICITEIGRASCRERVYVLV